MTYKLNTTYKEYIMKIRIEANGKVKREFETDEYALCDALADVNDVLKDFITTEKEE